jgi:hypothetical protein
MLHCPIESCFQPSKSSRPHLQRSESNRDTPRFGIRDAPDLRDLVAKMRSTGETSHSASESSFVSDMYGTTQLNTVLGVPRDFLSFLVTSNVSFFLSSVLTAFRFGSS